MKTESKKTPDHATIPAAGNGALALVFGRFHDAGGSALQLLINLTGTVKAVADLGADTIRAALRAPALRRPDAYHPW